MNALAEEGFGSKRNCRETIMKEIRCSNCGSRDIEFEKEIWVCRFCGSRYLPEIDELPRKTREKELEDELCDICSEIEKTSEFDDSQIDLRDRLFSKLNNKADQIIGINSGNPYAMTAKMLLQIYQGLDDEQSVSDFVDYIETAVNNSDDESKENTWNALAEHLIRFGPKVLKYNPNLKERVYRLIDIFGEYNIAYLYYPKEMSDGSETNDSLM